MKTIEPRAVTEVDTEIGARIRARRQELGVPQTHVAEMVGVTFQQFQKYEAGENRVSAAMLTRIAEALDVEPAALLPGRKVTPRRDRDASEDGMLLQLQRAFNQIQSRRERKLILDLARRLGGDAKPKPKKRAR